MSFEEFTGKGRKYWRSGTPSVTCTNAQIRPNKVARERYFDGCEYVKLWVDAENGRVGIEPKTEADADENCFKLTNNSFSGNSLFSSLGVDFDGETVMVELETDGAEFPYFVIPEEFVGE